MSNDLGMIKQKLKDFWKYLNTSPGTYQKLISSEPQTYGFTSLRGVGTEDVYKEVPYKTPLQKIILISIFVTVLIGIYLLGRACVLEKREARGRIIPDPEILKFQVKYKGDALEDIRRHREQGNPFTMVEESKVEIANMIIESYRERIKEKIKKGYLTPEHKYWNDYKAVFGQESWWPKDTNSLN